jgi:hypothetical protein
MNQPPMSKHGHTSQTGRLRALAYRCCLQYKDDQKGIPEEASPSPSMAKGRKGRGSSSMAEGRKKASGASLAAVTYVRGRFVRGR